MSKQNDIYIQLGLNRGISKYQDELIDQIEAAQRDLGLHPTQYVLNKLMPDTPMAAEARLQLSATQPATLHSASLDRDEV